MADANIKISIPEDIQIQLSPMTAEEILKSISDAASLELENNFKVDWFLIRKEALSFLSSITALDKEYSAFTTAQLKHVIAKPEIAAYANEIQKKKEDYYVQGLYMLAARFEDYLSRFREEDKERKIIYVLTSQDSSQIKGAFEMSFRELILNVNKHGRWQDIANKKLTSEGRVAKEEEGFFPQKHVEEAQAAYTGTINRWNRYFEVVKPGGQKQNGLIMWKEQRKWAMGNLLNTGDLKEAYTSFLFSEHEKTLLCNIEMGTKPYYGHEFIGAFFKEYITKVTNLEAVIEEDVLSTDKQYGVKGRKASLPSLQQYIDVANLILMQPNTLSKEELEQKILEKFKTESSGARNKILNTLEEQTKYITKNQLKKLQRTLS